MLFASEIVLGFLLTLLPSRRFFGSPAGRCEVCLFCLIGLKFLTDHIETGRSISVQADNGRIDVVSGGWSCGSDVV